MAGSRALGMGFPSRKWWYTVYRSSDGKVQWERRSYKMGLDTIQRLHAHTGLTYEILHYTQDKDVANDMCSEQGIGGISA